MLSVAEGAQGEPSPVYGMSLERRGEELGPKRTRTAEGLARVAPAKCLVDVVKRRLNLTRDLGVKHCIDGQRVTSWDGKVV